jgi:hypothetical protein
VWCERGPKLGVPHPPSPQMVIVMRSCSSIVVCLLSQRRAPNVPGCFVVCLSPDVLLGLVVTRSCGCLSSHVTQLPQLSIAAVSPCVSRTNKRKETC